MRKGNSLRAALNPSSPSTPSTTPYVVSLGVVQHLRSGGVAEAVVVPCPGDVHVMGRGEHGVVRSPLVYGRAQFSQVEAPGLALSSPLLLPPAAILHGDLVGSRDGAAPAGPAAVGVVRLRQSTWLTSQPLSRSAAIAAVTNTTQAVCRRLVPESDRAGDGVVDTTFLL